MNVPQHRAQPTIVTLPDQIDEANAKRVHEQLWAVCAPGATVVADMSSTRYCVSAGIRNLTLAHEHAKTLEGQLRLALPAGVVHRVLDLLGLDEVLLIYPTIAAAVNGHVPVPNGHPAGRPPPGGLPGLP